MVVYLIMNSAQVLWLSMVSKVGIMWNARERRVQRSEGERVLAGVAFVGTWRMIILVVSVGRSMINSVVSNILVLNFE
ncbi:hypothetical protein A2U01_0053433, partial [Trifolium medium]|nr:hypothetical protein [Trifolium medium]